MNCTFKYNISNPTRSDVSTVYIISEGSDMGQIINAAHSFINKNASTFKNWGAKIGVDKMTKLEKGETINGTMKKFNI